jgi:two-component system, cell cycle sensor histidine kinase and response regulator CckA
MGLAKVLVVDDEPAVLKLINAILTKSGYEVLGASDGHKALEIVNQPTAIDLVISDVVMPGMKGPELLDHVRKVSPSTALMLMTAYSPGDVLPAGPALVLRKPFMPAELLAAVERPLRGAARAADSSESSEG